MEIETVVIEANGLTFDGFSCGPSDAPLVLCLHGFPQFADCWIHVLPQLAAAGFRAVALNQRGYAKGASPDSVDDYALPLLIGDVLAFADKLGAEKFHLIGHDWGGIIGWKLAADHPEKLLSLNIVSTPHLDALREALLTTIDQIKKSSYIALFKAPFHLAEKALKADNWKTLRKAYARKVPTEQIDKNIERFSEGDRLTQALNWYRAFSLVGVNGKIKVRTLYIWGSKDQALGEHAAANTAKFVQAPYRFERLEGASHWLPDEKPDVLAKLFIEHMRPEADLS